MSLKDTDNMILTITFMIYTTWVFIATILNIRPQIDVKM